MIKTIDCGCYMSVKEREEFLRYCLNKYDDLDIEEKLECVKNLYDDYHTIIYDQEHDKLFVYGHGYMHELTDEEIKELIEADLVDNIF